MAFRGDSSPIVCFFHASTKLDFVLFDEERNSKDAESGVRIVDYSFFYPFGVLNQPQEGALGGLVYMICEV